MWRRLAKRSYWNSLLTALLSSSTTSIRLFPIYCMLSQYPKLPCYTKLYKIQLSQCKVSKITFKILYRIISTSIYESIRACTTPLIWGLLRGLQVATTLYICCLHLWSSVTRLYHAVSKLSLVLGKPNQSLRVVHALRCKPLGCFKFQCLRPGAQCKHYRAQDTHLFSFLLTLLPYHKNAYMACSKWICYCRLGIP